MGEGLTTKRHREPKQRTDPLPQERNIEQPDPMSGWEHLGKMHGLMWRAREVGRG